MRTENNQMIEFILNFVQGKQPHNTFIVTMFVNNININLNHLLFILGVCTLSDEENIFHGCNNIIALCFVSSVLLGVKFSN